MPISTIIIIAIGLALLLVVGRFLFALAAIAVPLIIGGIVLLFVADKATGGNAIDQIATKITHWIKSRTGG